jgi:ElaB/YqjD/DUF883 family membrane-anchored ribosome-binding protein
MSNAGTSVPNDGATFGGLADKISETASQATHKIKDLGRTTADKIDQNRDSAADGLDAAASKIHQQAENLPGGEKVTNLAHSAADKLTSTADYVRQHDLSSMMTDVERLVKNNPGPSLLFAGVIGFLVGRAFSND